MGRFHLLFSYAIFFRMFIYFIIVFQFGGLNTKKSSHMCHKFCTSELQLQPYIILITKHMSLKKNYLETIILKSTQIWHLKSHNP